VVKQPATQTLVDGPKGAVMPDRPTSSFSRNMSAALRGYIRERGISQSALAKRIERSEGFVSERLTGVRPPDTDMIDATAALAGISTARLYEELGRRAGTTEPDSDPPDATADAIVERARRAAREARKAKVSKPTRRGRRGA
jgi:transcriptional regulator with XRE-family HTH domain